MKTPEDSASDAQGIIADLRRQLAERTAERDEALDQQTATAEVLGVINSSPGDLAPVFDAMLEKAMHLCGAAFGQLHTYDGEGFPTAALRGLPAAYAEYQAENPPTYGPGTAPWRIVQGEQVVHLVDLANSEAYRAGEAARRATVDLGGCHTLLTVALRREDTLLGTVSLYRQEVRPFSDKQIALLQNFAAQAVIAMENARLLGELRQRTGDLEEALNYQTATSEVLKVISRSDADLACVLQTALDTAARLCEAETGHIFLRRGERLQRMASSIGVSTEWRADMDANPIAVDAHSTSGRAVLTGQVVQITDIAADPEYAHTSTGAAGIRTMLGVPLLRDGVPIGSMSLARKVVEPFTDRQIELVRTFADQAVIAIGNAHLLGELRARTEEVAELNRGLEARVAEQVEELGRVGRLKRFLAPQLAELIVSQGDEKILESHRREIVVVFCDLRGYTAFTETAEPEEVLDFLREYHGALGPLVAEYEGTLDQFSGDGIMVFFNDPVPIPDPAERAVKMAMAMREAAGNLMAAWRRHGSELGFGAGIAQGYATLGQIGFSDRSGYTAIGTVCNLAARLCAEAKDGQILVGSRIAEAVEAVVRLENLGNLELRGLRRPVAAFNVAQSTSEADARPNLSIVARESGRS
jgi:class 3 adenylate cyclase